jgi:TonB-linked SusC/RagA family outer membrane protein
MKQPKLKLFRLLLAFAVMCLPFLLQAQSVEVKGKISDAATGKPIDGATILVKNSKAGTSSNAIGEFSVSAKKGEKLAISIVGFESQTVSASANYMTIFLVADNKQLNEIVVTALGVKKEAKKIGYSVQEVKGADLLKAREANPVNGLVGKVAGLNVGINAELLASPTVLLRGSPLNFYIVDGIPINSDTWNISPDDIETYTVLKGPTAAALYGSRGINGAIMITTKRGKRNNKGFTVEVNSSTQINKGFIANPKVQNQYGGGDNQKYAFGDYNSNGTGSGVNDKDYDVWGPRLDAGLSLPQYDGAYDPNITYTTTFLDGSTFKGNIKPTPWVARGKNNLNNFLQAGLLTSNNVNFSSVTDRSNIRMSVSNGYQRGITPNTSLNTVNLNLVASYDVTDKFKVEGNINYNRQFSNNIPDAVYGPNSIIYNVDVWTGADWNVLDPKIRNYWQPGKEGIQQNFVEYKRYSNPWFSSYEWLRSHYKNDLYGWVAFTYKFNKDLDIMVRSNVTTYNVIRSEKEPWSAHPYGDEHGKGNYREDRRELWENNSEVLVRYNKENIAKSGFNLSAFGGASMRNMRYTSSYVSTDRLIVPNVYNFANSAKPIRAYSYGSELIQTSAYYSIDLGYKKYFNISTTGRLDKTSALPVGNNAYFYPSVTLSSAISDYVELPKAITFLKVRGGYTNVKDGGTSAFAGSSFQSLGTGGATGYGNNYYTPYDGPSYALQHPAYSTAPVYNNLTGAYAPDYVIDPRVKPSSRSNFEVGTDIRFLKNRVALSATYFQYTDGPVISSQPISEASGLSYFVTTGFTTKRTGAEFSLTGTPIQQKDFRWDVLVNWATYKEVFAKFAGGATTLGNGTGYPNKIGDRVDRLFSYYEALTPQGKVIHDESGYPIYLPKAQYLGHADPDWSWGVHNKFSYKSFSFAFQFDGMVGGKIQDRVLRKLTEGGRGENTNTGKIGAARLYESNHWGDAGYAGAVDANGIPILSGDGVQVVGGSGLIQYDPATGVISNAKSLSFTQNKTATFWIQDYVSSFFNDPQHTTVSKTYAKLREVVISYSLPKQLLPKSISKVDVSLVGRNLLYFFPAAFKDMDVDQYPGRDQFGGARLEYNLQTPTTRSYGVNINVVF